MIADAAIALKKVRAIIRWLRRRISKDIFKRYVADILFEDDVQNVVEIPFCLQ